MSRFRKAAEVALEKERQEAERKALREVLFTLVQTRFPEISRLTKLLASAVKNTHILQTLILQMSVASNLEEARQHLFDIGEEENSN